MKGHDGSKVETMVPVKDRIITVNFNADLVSSMQWNFKPQQPQVNVSSSQTCRYVIIIRCTVLFDLIVMWAYQELYFFARKDFMVY